MLAYRNLQFSKGSLNRPTKLCIFLTNHITIVLLFMVLLSCAVLGFVIPAATRTCPATVYHFTQWYSSRTLVRHLGGRLPFRVGQWLGFHMLCVNLPMPSAGINTISTMDLLLSTSRQAGGGGGPPLYQNSALVIMVDQWLQNPDGHWWKV